MKVKNAHLKITFPLSHSTLRERHKHYYSSLLSALITEQPFLLKETSDTRKHYHFLLFTFFFQILVMPKQRTEGGIRWGGGIIQVKLCS